MTNTALALIGLLSMGLGGCASFGGSLADFNQKFDQFNAEYERQLWAQTQESQKNAWGVVESVRLITRASLVRGEPPRQMQELVVRVAGRTNDVRVLYLPLDTAPYRVGSSIYLR